MGKLSNDQKRNLAEDYYINQFKTGKWIAEILDVTEATIVRWKHGRKGEQDWDTRRGQMISTPKKLRQLIQRQMLLVLEGNKPDVDADQIVKYASALDKIDAKVGVQTVVEVMMELDKFIMEEAPEKAIDFARIHKSFIHFRAAQA
jgi:transposase